MSASAVDFGTADGIPGETLFFSNSTYSFNNLASWCRSRICRGGQWSVAITVRGLSVSCLAVIDDFGDLQIVKVQ